MYGLPQMVVVQRFSNLPVIRTSINKATDIYVRVKKSNRLIQWSLQTAEATVTIAVDLSKSTFPIVLLDGPIHLIDEILCKSLDMVEDAVPMIKQEPNEIYLEARSYVTTVMEPMLKRADSVKEISITYSNKAAESLDSVLTAADGIVDKYLPEMKLEGVDVNDGPVAGRAMTKYLLELVDAELNALRGYGVSVLQPPRNPTEKTMRHVGKLSRTLKRRLTQRTIYEARALKKQGKNIIHVLLQMTDMLARDPKAFVQRMKDLWKHLSQDEPENQEPPQNLEELIVMLTREGVRRFVHVANFLTYNTVRIPEYARNYINFALLKYSEYLDSLDLKSTGIRRHAEILKHAIQDIFDQFLNLIKPMLGYSNSGRDVKISLQNFARAAIEAGTKSLNDIQANGAVAALTAN